MLLTIVAPSLASVDEKLFKWRKTILETVVLCSL